MTIKNKVATLFAAGTLASAVAARQKADADQQDVLELKDAQEQAHTVVQAELEARAAVQRTEAARAEVSLTRNPILGCEGSKSGAKPKSRPWPSA